MIPLNTSSLADNQPDIENMGLISYRKNNSRGWPSSDNRKEGLVNEPNSEINLLAETTERCLKCGEEFDSAIIKAGYRELSCPDVVATILYID